MALLKNIDFNIIKYIAIFITFINIIFNDYIHINSKTNFIEIDNEFKYNLYENDTSFYEYQTKLKPIAFYYPEYSNISFLKYFNKKRNINLINNSSIYKLIMKQKKLAKRHGIYGFAIYFDFPNLNYYFNIIINIFSVKIKFPFFLIWRNNKAGNIGKEIFENLIKNISKYIVSDNYIKIKGKPIFSISSPYNFSNINNIITKIRHELRLKEIGEIYIIYPFTGNYKDNNFLIIFDATYDFSNIDLFEHKIIIPNILYYSGIIYKNLILNELKFNFSIFRTCKLNYKNFNDYNPEKFYISNNIIFKWAKINYNQNEGIVFIDSWNDYKNGNYLEPDEIYGYSSINSFSKSIFNLPFNQNNLASYNSSKNIAIQIHVFYEDLLMEIINKLNLIDIKYDLYISTISKEKKEFIEKILLNSKANYYEIEIFQNKGRDVFPFLMQMKKKYKNYKYICHIHTKKSNHKSLLGENWRNYIYSNLFGNRNIVAEILFEFEQKEKLGFIYPETYYDIIKDVFLFNNINFALNKPNKKYINYIMNKLLRKFKIGEKLEFPAGNMFWAKIKAIYQIFNIKLQFPKELNQTNGTIMHGIERIWLYLVKLNGYYYKTIFKHY